MTLAKSVRKESHAKSIDSFSTQEKAVLDSLDKGCNHAWIISYDTGMLITSVRRCLTCLCKSNVIEESGTSYYSPTKRTVTNYKRILKLIY